MVVCLHLGHMKTSNDQHMNEKPSDLLSVGETAKRYEIPEGTLRYWIRHKLIPSYKIGRRRKLKRADVDAFIESGREEVE